MVDTPWESGTVQQRGHGSHRTGMWKMPASDCEAGCLRSVRGDAATVGAKQLSAESPVCYLGDRIHYRDAYVYRSYHFWGRQTCTEGAIGAGTQWSSPAPLSARPGSPASQQYRTPSWSELHSHSIYQQQQSLRSIIWLLQMQWRPIRSRGQSLQVAQVRRGPKSLM